MSKIGVHVIGGPRDGYGPFLQRIHDAGQVLAVVKCVDDFGAAYGAKQSNPLTLTVGRLNGIRAADGSWIDLQAFEPRDWPSGAAAANAYYSLVRPKWELNRGWIDYWETFNEFSAHYDYQADFYIRMMGLAEADGFQLGLFACSTGNPPRPGDNHPDAAVAYPAIVRTCLRAKQGSHILTLHEYGNPMQGTQPFHALRYRTLADTLRAQNALVPIVISECGFVTFPGVEPFIADSAWYDSELMKDDYILGGAEWTLGQNVNWPSSNIQTALSALAEYIITHPTPAPTPDPDPEPTPTPLPCRGAPRTQYARVYVVIHGAHDGLAPLERWYGVVGKYQFTVGPSADDGGIGDLDNRTVVIVNPQMWSGGDQAMRDWYAQYYPGTRYLSTVANSPDALDVWLAGSGLR